MKYNVSSKILISTKFETKNLFVVHTTALNSVSPEQTTPLISIILLLLKGSVSINAPNLVGEF